MSDRRHNWKRLWRPPDAARHLTEEGRLWNPGSSRLPLDGQQVVPFESIARVPWPCLARQPGMPGGTEAQLRHEFLIGAGSETDEAALWFDLRDHGTGGFLCRRVLTNAEIDEWQAGSYSLQ